MKLRNDLPLLELFRVIVSYHNVFIAWFGGSGRVEVASGKTGGGAESGAVCGWVCTGTIEMEVRSGETRFSMSAGACRSV